MKSELVFILDRSGSMSGLESDTIGGFNAMLEKQTKAEGEAVVTTVLFDDKYELLHDRINIDAIAPITEKDYFVRGSTALLDAVGMTLQKIINVQKMTVQGQKVDKVLFVITTDGLENASREYSYAVIRQMIEHQKKHYNWEFIFLGANIDAVGTAAKFGISEDRAANFHADSHGTKLNYEVISDAVSSLRANNTLDKKWKSKIDDDFLSRSNKGR
jgi:uncharacterized protein YegL